MVSKISFVLGVLALFSAPDGLLDPDLPPGQDPETIPDPVMNMGDVEYGGVLEDVLSSFLATLAPLCIVFLVVRLVHCILLALVSTKKELKKANAGEAALEAQLKVAKKELKKANAREAALEAQLKVTKKELEKSNNFSAFVLGFVDQRSEGV